MYREGDSVARSVVDRDVAAVLLHDTVGYGKTQAGTFAGFFGSEKWLEHLVDESFGNSTAVVDHIND